MSQSLHSLLSIAMINTVTSSSLGRLQCVHLTADGPTGREIRARTQSEAGPWRQELKQRPCRSTLYWLVLHGSLRLHLFLQPRTTCPWVIQHTVGYSLPHQSLIKNDSRMCQPASVMEALSQWDPLFPDDSSLCQVDKNKTNLTNTDSSLLSYKYNIHNVYTHTYIYK